MKRICPFCKSELTKSDVHFCSHCGSALPENLEEKESFAKSFFRTQFFKNTGKKLVKTKVKRNAKPVSSFDPMLIISAFLVVVGLGVCIYYLVTFFTTENKEHIMLKLKDTPQPTPTVTAPKATPTVVTISEKEEIGPLAQSKATDFVLYNSDLYADFYNLEDFSQYFGKSNEDVALFVSENQKDLSHYYALFTSSTTDGVSWNFIFFTTNPELVIKGYGDLVISKVGDAVIFSDNKKIMEEIKSVKSGLSKSLNVNPAFIQIKNKANNEGKAFVIALSPKGKSNFASIVEKTDSSELKSIIQSFLSSKSNYILIN